MVYDCQINGHDGVAMTDSGATRVSLKKTYAEDSNIRFDKSQARDVQLPNGSTMRIVSECHFDMVMSSWKRPVHGIIVDLQANFDVVLGLNWLREVEPIPEWKTLNWYVQTAEGVVCLKHRNQVEPEPHRPKLTTLQIDTKEDFEWITEKDAKKALRKGARCVLHYARAYTDDSNSRPRLNSIRDLGDVDDPKLQQLLEEYQDIFREELPKELPPELGVVHTIDTGDEKPVNRNAYPLSVQQLREQTRQVESLLERCHESCYVSSIRLKIVVRHLDP
jgi:gag-polyprotein putative aspartyl protease